jgi:TonB-dependent receptor
MSALRTGASAFALFLSVGSALGQAAAPAQDIETVNVTTGAIAAVAGALDVKKEATQIIDSIVAEDIGKLPDTTVVESLQHVTGVAIVRNAIEPSVVLIRGLPDVQTLLNGREIFTSTGRAISLPDLPSELLSQVDVHKASSATDLEGGIAGLIDVHLHRPFDFKGFVFAASAQATNQSLAGHIDPQVSFLASDRWSTNVGEVGLLLDISYKKGHTRADEMQNQSPFWSNVVGPVTGAGSGPLIQCTLPASSCNLYTGPVNGGQNILATGGKGVYPGYAGQTPTTTLYQRQGFIERASLNLSSQWKPADNLLVYAETFYTRLRNEQPVFVDVLLQYVCPDPAMDAVYSGTNVVSKSVSSCYNLTSMQDRHSKEDTWQIAAGADWYVDDNLHLSTEVDVTGSKSLTIGLIPDDTYNIPTDGLQLITNYNGTMAHYITQLGNGQENPSGQYIDQWFDQRTLSKGSEWDWRLDGSYDFGQGSFLRSLETGLRVADRAAHNNGAAVSSLNCITAPNTGNFYNPFVVAANSSAACAGPSGYVTLGSGGIGGSTPQQRAANYTTIGGIPISSLGTGATAHTHGNFFGGKFGTTGWTNADPNWLWQNPDVIRKLFGYDNVVGFGSTSPADYSKSGPPDTPANLFIVSEVSWAAYMKANFAFEVFGYPLDGNVGVRYIDTTLTEQANNSLVSGSPAVLTYTPTVASHETGDLNPSLNMRLTLDDNLFVRFAASKTTTRPTFAQLNPAQSFNGGGTTLPGSSTSGNPNLTAVKSLNLDLDAEYYWGRANHIVVAGFHRYVQGYIQNQSQGNITVNGLLYLYTKPVNYQNAYIDGAEVGYSQFLDFLPGFWSGFGWDANATYIAGPFNNITKWHFNAAGIYEQGPYSFRVSYTWSSSYQVNPSLTSGTQPLNQWAMPRANLDASFNYRLNDNWTFTVDATNLNNGLYRAYDGHGVPNAPRLFNVDYERFDKTYSIGVRYRM